MSEQRGRRRASSPQHKVAVCDLDGTLIDSDAALADAFVALGIDRQEITFGHVLADECVRLGLSVEEYVAAYDTTRRCPSLESPSWSLLLIDGPCVPTSIRFQGASNSGDSSGFQRLRSSQMHSEVRNN